MMIVLLTLFFTYFINLYFDVNDILKQSDDIIKHLKHLENEYLEKTIKK